MAKKEKSREKADSLVKMNSDIYREVAEIVEANPIDYPSIKNFVEVAVRNQISMIKYDIENMPAIMTKDGRLKPSGSREFTNCLACGNLFLNEKDKNRRGRKVCPKCSKIIKNLSGLID